MAQVRVETDKAAPGNARVVRGTAYAAQVTLSIEAADGSLTPSGWSTRKEGGGDDKPFVFTPGVNLIQGWTDGVVQMREGERARIHVPYALGYGTAAQGQSPPPSGGWRRGHARARARLRACLLCHALPRAPLLIPQDPKAGPGTFRGAPTCSLISRSWASRGPRARKRRSSRTSESCLSRAEWCFLPPI